MFALADRLDFFANKFAGLRGSRFPIAPVAPRSFNGSSLRHNLSPE
jgi:hypothetical protein